MAEILHHLGCMKPYKQWDKLPTSTGERRISAINSINPYCMNWGMFLMFPSNTKLPPETAATEVTTGNFHGRTDHREVGDTQPFWVSGNCWERNSWYTTKN